MRAAKRSSTPRRRSASSGRRDLHEEKMGMRGVRRAGGIVSRRRRRRTAAPNCHLGPGIFLPARAGTPRLALVDKLALVEQLSARLRDTALVARRASVAA